VVRWVFDQNTHTHVFLLLERRCCGKLASHITYHKTIVFITCFAQCFCHVVRHSLIYMDYISTVDSPITRYGTFVEIETSRSSKVQIEKYVPPEKLPFSIQSQSHPRSRCNRSSSTSIIPKAISKVIRFPNKRNKKVAPLQPISECPICLENIPEECLCVTSCGHVFHDSCMGMLKRSQPFLGTVTRCPLCRSLVDNFSSRLVQWRQAYRAHEYKHCLITYPAWTVDDEMTVYTFVVGEMVASGMKVEDMGMEPHHKAFLLSTTSHFMDMPTIDFLNGVNSD
jgi:hypothetical protein